MILKRVDTLKIQGNFCSGISRATVQNLSLQYVLVSLLQYIEHLNDAVGCEVSADGRNSGQKLNGNLIGGRLTESNSLPWTPIVYMKKRIIATGALLSDRHIIY
jgi:hypothetical protein